MLHTYKLQPFRSAIQWLPDDLPLNYDILNYWISTPWDTRNGRATLAGDAAHPMPPHRGQGLNHAIQDAYNLVSILTKSASASTDPDTLGKQIQDYSDEVASRGAAEVELSRTQAFMALNWKTLQESPFMKHGVDRSPQFARGDGTTEEHNKAAVEA